MATQKLKRRRVTPEESIHARAPIEEELPSHAAPARKSRAKKKAPIEAPPYWRTRGLKIEPIFDPSLIETPAQMGVAQIEQGIRAALDQQEAAERRNEAWALGNSSKAGALADAALQNSEAAEAQAAAATPAYVLTPPVSIPSEAAQPALGLSEETALQQPALAPLHAASEVISFEELAKEQKFEHLRTPLSIHSGSMGAVRARERQKAHALARVIDWLARTWRRMQALLARLNGPSLTPSGRITLSQLQRLYALISAGFNPDEMEMVRLRVAFGEAYYHVMEASRRHKSRRRADEPAEYQAYIERFLAAENGE
ncbi:MAG: hypothetical protein M1530_04255 [Candidatus Marsarchaeota archaeon]|nr:hypothetical protein [Candidatus Marsarchaeota archaeon]